jgi:hypothetical protein
MLQCRMDVRYLENAGVGHIRVFLGDFQESGALAG